MPTKTYTRLIDAVTANRCVILDGAVGTELVEVGGGRPELDDQLWGVTAVVSGPEAVRAVHGRYVGVGVDVVSTDTWGLPSAVRRGVPRAWNTSTPVHWMDVARQGVRLAREAAADHGRQDEVAVAFSVNDDIDTPDADETIALLERSLQDEPPDLILMETLSLVHQSTFATVERLLETGIPLWLSFRRCRHGVCGVYGEHWGGPEGDTFGRAARRFEQLGVGALMINCIPPDHVSGMVSWLRDFTDLPLGVYPNLGYLSADGWRSSQDVDPARYAELALDWRAEGAQIIGGCCGVGPGHIAAAREALSGTVPGSARPAAVASSNGTSPAAQESPWTDPHGRRVFPIAFPELVVDAAVDAPTQGSLMLWKHIASERIGAHQRCLDLGTGSGLLAVQLARNGADHVHAVDRAEAATTNAMGNAFRNGVADRVTATTIDLYPWIPEERYDVIVAGIEQRPADPFGQIVSHRRVDYWGRNLLDHTIGLLPEALADDGVAYLVQLSIVGEHRTLELLDSLGLQARVLDFAFAEMTAPPAQVERVEAQSDAYHLKLGPQAMLIAYLLEVTREAGQG